MKEKEDIDCIVKLSELKTILGATTHYEEYLLDQIGARDFWSYSHSEELRKKARGFLTKVITAKDRILERNGLVMSKEKNEN